MLSFIQKIKKIFTHPDLDNIHFDEHIATKEDMVNHNKDNNTKKQNYQFEKSLDESQAYITYSMAYNNLYNAYIKKTKQDNIKENEDPNYTMRKLFELSQSAFILATSTFNYTIINGYVSKTHIQNIIKSKLREFELDWKTFNSEEQIPINIEMLSFYDNSVLLRVLFKNIETSQQYYHFLTRHKDKFEQFIQDSHNKAKKESEQFINNDKPLTQKDRQKIEETLGEDYLQKIKQNNQLGLDSKTAKEIYEIQSKQTLDYVDFGYVSAFNLLLENFYNGVLIDISDFDSLFHHLKITGVRKFFNGNHMTGKQFKNKIRQDIKTKEELYNFLQKNHMLIKLAKRKQ